MKPSFISIIITTYNRPSALKLILVSLAEQKNSNFEVVIADDGSSPETKEMLGKLQLPYSLQHIWQEDCGFQAAKIRNKAANYAKGDYLIFIDGDCIPTQHFVNRHKSLAQKNCFVSGNRILLSKDFTQKVIEKTLSIQHYSLFSLIKLKFKKQLNRIFPLFYLPGQRWRVYSKSKWKGAKTCNLALWKKDFITINGFDEQYQGWGYEDSDLVIRLMKAGVKRKDGRFGTTVFHLWHLENDRSTEKENLLRLKEIEQSSVTKATMGFDQYNY